ncbi:ABC transporter substrate-binding protein [Nitrospinota bacterium]
MSRVLSAARQRPYFKRFDRIEIIDDKTFIWHNKKHDNGMFNRLARWAGPISLNAKGKDKAHLSRNTYGSGPYVLESWTKGNKLVFKANKKWWGNKQFPRPPRVLLSRGESAPPGGRRPWPPPRIIRVFPMKNTAVATARSGSGCAREGSTFSSCTAIRAATAEIRPTSSM